MCVCVCVCECVCMCLCVLVCLHVSVFVSVCCVLIHDPLWLGAAKARANTSLRVFVCCVCIVYT